MILAGAYRRATRNWQNRVFVSAVVDSVSKGNFSLAVKKTKAKKAKRAEGTRKKTAKKKVAGGGTTAKPKAATKKKKTETKRLAGELAKTASPFPIVGLGASAGGLEALEELAENKVDLLIADIDMPEMDGVTLVKTVRADERFSQLPVIVLTASGEDDDYQTAREAGANDVLTKPASSQELLATIEQVMA